MGQPLEKHNHIADADASAELAQWVEKAKAGNKMAFERLIGLFHEQIFRMVYFRTHSEMDAEDLTQEIFLKAFNNVSGLKEIHRFKSWLFTIASNRVRDFYRKKKFQKLFSPIKESDKEGLSDSGTDANPDALNDLMRKDFWMKVKLLLKKLSKMEKEVFLLRYMDNLSIKEVSQVMKKNESTVKTHLYRALGKFRKEPSMRQFLEGDSA